MFQKTSACFATDLAVQQEMLISKANFVEFPIKAANLILIDYENHLVARLKKASEASKQDLSINLELAIKAIEGGAPFLPPSLNRILTIVDKSDSNQKYFCSLYPLADNNPITHHHFAKVLSQIHKAAMPDNLPSYLEVRKAKTAKVLTKLAQIKNLPAKLIKQCLKIEKKLFSDLEKTFQELPQVLVHGDAHAGNVVIYKNKPVAIDLDNISFGPQEVDFNPVFLHAQRYPGADPQAGVKLLKALNYPVDEKVIKLIVDYRSILRVIDMSLHWGETGV